MVKVSITLETSESINQQYIHPSRSSPMITKVHSEHHVVVVADIRQTSFLFSVPIDGPMTFSTPKVSVHWSLKFEFFTTPEGLDISRYEHPRFRILYCIVSYCAVRESFDCFEISARTDLEVIQWCSNYAVEDTHSASCACRDTRKG